MLDLRSPRSSPDLNDGDVAVLQFLAAAELVESDLWGQYSELASKITPSFRRALSRIKDMCFPIMSMEILRTRASHASFINAFLVAAGREPVNLDAFRTLPTVPVDGARQVGRLTNLTSLTVDTSYYERYRNKGDPDFGDTFPQTVDIKSQPTVPTSNKIRGLDFALCCANRGISFRSDRTREKRSLLQFVDHQLMEIITSLGDQRTVQAAFPPCSIAAK